DFPSVAFAAAPEEFSRAFVYFRPIDELAVDKALQTFPQISVRPLAQEPALGGVLAAGEVGRQQLRFFAHSGEGTVVTDKRVVEVDADSHGGNAHSMGC